MINEVLEATEYLEGKNITKGNLYRICFMLAKLFCERGMSKIEARESIFDWANRNYIHIDFNVNSIIYHAINSKRRLRSDTSVYVSKKDVEEINRRFDNKNTKLVALAVLCYAKVAADANGDFQLASTALGAWLNLDPSNIRKRYLSELCDFDYLIKEPPQVGVKWRKGTVYAQPSTRYRINVPHDNSGEFELKGNRVRELFQKIF